METRIGSAFCPVFVGCLLSAPALTTQRVIATLDGEPQMRLGYVTDFPDVDGDGRNDFLIASESPTGFENSLVSCYSSATLTPIWRVRVGLINLTGGLCGDGETVVLGDFDGDGDVDIAVGCPAFFGTPSEVFIVDGTTGQVLMNIVVNESNFGKWLGAPGDTNGDGFADLIVGDQQGRQTLYLGPNAVVGEVFDRGFQDPISGAGTVGDIDLDGADDFALGWGGSGVVDVYSGRTRTLLASMCTSPTFCAGFFGLFPGALGDLNGDQIPDFALSAFDVALPEGLGGFGFVRILSGADYSTLHEVHARPMSPHIGPEFLGSYVSGGHDVNGDGVPDVAAAGSGFINGNDTAVVISGRTGQMLYQVRPAFESGTLDIGFNITSASTIPDLDGDGFDDWAVANHLSDEGGVRSGRVIFLAGGPGDVEPVCDALPHSQGDVARIQLYGAITEFSRGLEVRIDRAIPNSQALIAFGLRSSPTPLGDGVLCIGVPGFIRYGAPRLLDGSGSLRRDIDWGEPVIGYGATAWTVGTSWTVQAVYRDPQGTSRLNTTNALEVTINR